MQAITTKYHPATNTRGARISASTESGIRVSIPYPHDATSDDKHWRAVEALCRKLGWSGTLCEGAIKGGYVYVFVEDRYTRAVSNPRKAAA